MPNVSTLPGSDKIKPVLTAFKYYQAAVAKDELSQVYEEAKLPDAQVFYREKNCGVIIILPERHDSTEGEVQAGAMSVAKKVMAIPKVKIAIEEPIRYNGTLLSNVGWAKKITTKPQSMSLFDFEASAQGSISHQIYVRQVGYMIISSSRYPAEAMPRDPQRYNNPRINETMARNLRLNTSKLGDVSVFPVGPDHLSARYDPNTLSVHLRKEGWKMLDRK